MFVTSLLLRGVPRWLGLWVVWTDVLRMLSVLLKMVLGIASGGRNWTMPLQML